MYSDSEDEVDSKPSWATSVPAAHQGPLGTPLQLQVDMSWQAQAPSCIPLCVVTNPQSAWNKVNNIHTNLREIGPDILI